MKALGVTMLADTSPMAATQSHARGHRPDNCFALTGSDGGCSMWDMSFKACLSLPPPALSTGLTGATLPALSIPTWMALIGASLRIHTSSGPMG